jgi:hypothetical protein
MIKKLYRRFRDWMAFNPPGALSMTGWNQFNREFHETAPIRYYFHNDFRGNYVYPIKHKCTDISDWVRFRITDRNHVLPTGLKPGYISCSRRILHANFQTLVDHVEIYLSGYTFYDSPEYKELPVWKRKGLFRARKIRSRKYGIKYLEWAATLDDPNLPVFEQAPAQAVAAREIMALYKWWIDERCSALPKYDQSDNIDTEMLGRLMKIRLELD